MLERATACLKSGAFRESLRRARDVRRSKRMLHSMFWSHGAGDLDLPPWALWTGRIPPDLPLKHDSANSGGEDALYQSRDGQSQATVPFLDFLYPPQALAYLERWRGQQMQTFEKRNMRRLPKGYVVVSRRYASDSYRPFGEDEGETRRRKQQVVGNRRKKKMQDAAAQYDHSAEYRSEDRTESVEHLGSQVERGDGTLRDGNVDKLISELQKPDMESQHTQGSAEQENSSTLDTDDTSATGFGDSPGDIAELSADRTQLLRSILMFSREGPRRKELGDNQALTQRAWAIYESLDEETKNDIRLKQELLNWLAAQDNEPAIARCQQLFRSIPRSSRSSEVYQAVLSIYLRRAQHDLARELHREALEHVENGYLISRLLFRHAVDERLWQLAVNTAVLHDEVYSEANQINQMRVFWLHVSEIPRLFVKATELAKHFGRIDGLRSLDTQTREFCLRFFKEAVSQEFLRSEDDKALAFTEGRFDEDTPRNDIRAIFQHVIDIDPNPARFLEDVMLTALQEGTRREYSRYHHVLSYVYQRYCELPNAVPSETLLIAFLRQLGKFWPTLRNEYQTWRSVDISRLIDDWKTYHGRLSAEAVTLLLSQYARFGQVQRYEDMLQYQQEAYPEYNDQKNALWTRIYIHARRSDLDSAQQAFSEVQRIMGEQGERPDLQCWNVLLHAHMRADDLDGALTNFHNTIHHAKLRPDSYSFSALTNMLAQRGDVEGVEDLLEQYDTIVGESRTTEMMVALMVASFNNGDDFRAAEKVLERTIAMRSQGEVTGSLTPCFNALMTFYAIRRDINATMRTYRKMRQEKVRLNDETFGALMLVLIHYRQAPAAFTILRKVMPEHHIEPTSYHYSLLMAGLTKQGTFQEAVDLYQKMIDKNIKPSPSTNAFYLRAKAGLERRQAAAKANANSYDDHADVQEVPLPLQGTLQELQELLDTYDARELASGQVVSVSIRINLADPIAAYFDGLMEIHGERKCAEAVQALFDLYKKQSKLAEGAATVPLRMLTALMSAQWHAGEHAKVEEYWKLARQQADEIARSMQIPQFAAQMEEAKANVDPLELKPFHDAYVENNGPSPGEASEIRAPRTTAVEDPKQSLLTEKQAFQPRPSPGRTHILNWSLQWYIKALTSQSRVYDAIQVVSSLLTQGYTLTKTSWNLFIRSLLDTRPPLALLAFVLTERFMIQNFPGWNRNVRWAPKPISHFEGLQHLNARYLPRKQVVPEYLTLVRLGSAMLDLRRFEATGSRGIYDELPQELRKFVGTIRDIRSKASKTVYAVQSMPAVSDKTQAKYLKGDQG